MAARRQLIVSVDEEHVGRLAGIVEQLEAQGMEIGRTLPSLGTITGVLDESRVEAVRTITGVASVEPSREIRLPPPESDLQ